MDKIELEYMDLYEILSELIYNNQLENPSSLHDFCLNQFEKYQPERSKREDIKYFGMKAEIREDGLCYFEDGRVIDPSKYIDDAVL